MAIVRWEPARDVASLQQDVNRLFASFFDPNGAGPGTARWTPAVDLEEHEDVFVLAVDLPGVSEDDVAIDVEGDALTISGARGRRTPEGAQAVRTERGHGTFRRRLTLPEGIDPEGITAAFERGVLEVRIPKPVAARPRRVSIQVGDRPRTLDADRREDGGDDVGAPAAVPRGGSPEPAGAAS